MNKYLMIMFKVLYIHYSLIWFHIIHMVWVCWWKNIIQLRTTSSVWKVSKRYNMKLLYSEQGLPRLAKTVGELKATHLLSTTWLPGCMLNENKCHTYKHLFTSRYRNSYTISSQKFNKVLPQSTPAMDWRCPPKFYSWSLTLNVMVFGGGASFRR